MSVPNKILKIFGFEERKIWGYSANNDDEHKDKSRPITLLFEKIINLFKKASVGA